MSHVSFQGSITSKHPKSIEEIIFGEIPFFNDVDNSNFGSRIFFPIEKLFRFFFRFYKNCLRVKHICKISFILV